MPGLSAKLFSVKPVRVVPLPQAGFFAGFPAWPVWAALAPRSLRARLLFAFAMLVLAGLLAEAWLLASAPHLALNAPGAAAVAFGLAALLITVFSVLLAPLLRPLAQLAAAAEPSGMAVEDPAAGHGGELALIAQRLETLARTAAEARRREGELLRRLANAREEERQALAAELHDEAGPYLFAIGAATRSLAKLAAGLPPETACEVQRCAGDIRAAGERLVALNREMLTRLRPCALGQAPLTALLSGLLAGFSRRHPEIRFVSALDLPPLRYGGGLDLTVYRLVQEGVTNAIRHGGATAVTVGLQEARGGGRAGKGRMVPGLALSIHDNGKGISAPFTPGFGLTLMQERVEASEGTFSLRRGWPAGTAIEIWLPLESQARDDSSSSEVLAAADERRSRSAAALAGAGAWSAGRSSGSLMPRRTSP